MFSFGVSEFAAAVDLPQSSQPGPQRENLVGAVRVIVLEFRECDRARSNERHLAPRDMIKLRNFIERVTPAKGGEPASYPYVAGTFGRRNMTGHGFDTQRSKAL